MERKFGIEIEMYGNPVDSIIAALQEVGIHAAYEHYNHTTRRHWKFVQDASIDGRRDGRRVDNAIELVSPILQGEAGLEEVRKVGEVLTRIGQRVHGRCGLHVHYDAFDLTVAHAKKIVERYTRFETEIDAVLAPSRRGDTNQYCHTMRLISPRILGCNAQSLSDLAYAQGDRFHKLNLTSFNRHGTIEVRHHHGTVDPVKIVNWIRFGLSFIERSKELSTTEPVNATTTHAPMTPPGVNRPRRRTRLSMIASMIEDGRTASQIGARFLRPLTHVRWAVTALQNQYGVRLRIEPIPDTSILNTRTGRTERDFRIHIVRWFGEVEPPTPSTDPGPPPEQEPPETADASAFDGCTDDLKTYFAERARQFASEDAAA